MLRTTDGNHYLSHFMIITRKYNLLLCQFNDAARAMATPTLHADCSVIGSFHGKLAVTILPITIASQICCQKNFFAKSFNYYLNFLLVCQNYDEVCHKICYYIISQQYLVLFWFVFRLLLALSIFRWCITLPHPYTRCKASATKFLGSILRGLATQHWCVSLCHPNVF